MNKLILTALLLILSYFLVFPGPTDVLATAGSDGNFTVSGTFNININAHPGRSCADGASYSVTTLTSTYAIISGNVNGCISPGDEILLINLQGTPSNNNNAGNYEILTVTAASSNYVYFNAKTKLYGDNGSDNNIGTGQTNQKVLLQRIPNYQNLTINGGSVLTANPFDSSPSPVISCNYWCPAVAWNWSTTKGGLLVVKINGILLNYGSINMDGKGFAGGSGRVTSESNYGQCNDPVCGITGWQGNSYAGNGRTNSTPGGCNDSYYQANFGGGGAGWKLHGSGWDCYNGANAGGGGYGTGGGTGNVSVTTCYRGWIGDDEGDICTTESRAVVSGGTAYGVSNLSKLYIGSGGGSGGMYSGGNKGFTSGAGGNGGGIIFLSAPTIQNYGSISSKGTNGGNGRSSCGGGWCGAVEAGGGGSGGSIYLRSVLSTQGSTDISGGSAGRGPWNNDTGGAGGSGRFATVVIPPPLPPSVTFPSSVTLPSCFAINDSGSNISISWTNNDAPVTWVDISTNNFATYYHKNVAGTTVTNGSGFSGFQGTSGILTFNPNTTYYVRTYNGYINSAVVTLNPKPSCSDAEYISPIPPAQICPSSTMNAGEISTNQISVTMKNTGSLSWPAGGKYKLGSENALGYPDWGNTKFYIIGGSLSIVSGNSYTFQFYPVAPNMPGNYKFHWRMVEDSSGISNWFGKISSPDCTVTVTIKPYLKTSGGDVHSNK